MYRGLIWATPQDTTFKVFADNRESRTQEREREKVLERGGQTWPSVEHREMLPSRNPNAYVEEKGEINQG